MADFYYNGGDRDDANNYSANNWKKTKELPVTKPETIKFKIPDCFNEDYYLENRNKFSKFSEDYWEWTKFLRFSNAVFLFYRQMAVEFYSKFAPVKQLPEIVDLKLKKEDINEVLNSINFAESQLVEQFNKSSRRTLKAKIKAIKPLREVVNYASSAWIMHLATTDDLFIKNAIKFKTKYNNLDFTDDLDILKAYRGAVVMKYLTSKAIHSNLITDKIKRSEKIYENVDAKKLVNQLLENVGGFLTDDYDKIIDEFSNKVSNLNPLYNNLVYFYKNFFKMYKVANQVQEITKFNEQLIFGKSFVVNGRNLYEELANYYIFALNMLDDESLDEVFKLDLNYFAKKVGKIIKGSLETYLKTEEV